MPTRDKQRDAKPEDPSTDEEFVDEALDGALDEEIERAAEVEKPRVQARRRVEAAVRLVADVDIGAVEELQRVKGQG